MSDGSLMNVGWWCQRFTVTYVTSSLSPLLQPVVAAAAAATYTRIPPVSCRVGGVVVKK
jgi:hypothetical protein